MDRRFGAAIALILAVAATVFGAGAREVEVGAEPPEDPREEYLVRFQAFADEGVSTGNLLLLRSMPRVLAEELSVLPDHQLSEAERRALAENLLTETVREAGAELDDAVESRAELLFEIGREDEIRLDIQEAEEEVEQARARLAAAQALNREDVEIAEAKPLSFGAEDEEPLGADRLPARLAREEDLDLVVSGSMEEIDGTLIVRVRAYHRFLEDYVYDRRVAGAPGNTDELLAPIRDDLAEILLGRPWGRLSVETSASGAAIYVDDRLVGFGSATLEYARVGEREVRVSRDGFEDETREVEIAAFETTTLEVPFDVADAADVRIESNPTGADVYVGSIWQGVTPITLDRPEVAQTVMLEREGFLEETVVLSPEAPPTINRELVPDPGNWPEIVEQRRDRFYRSLGWFALSLPVPIILNGMFTDIEALFPGGEPAPDLSDAEAERLARTANTLLWTTRGTAAISGGLFVNMMVRLIQYIRAGEYSHDEN